MEPRIHSGDVVIVQKDVPPENGEVALVRLAGLADDEYTIKRVYLSNGVITLRSYNPALSPHDLQMQMKFVLVSALSTFCIVHKFCIFIQFLYNCSMLRKMRLFS